MTPVVFEFLRPQENVTLDAGQNPGTTKIPLPLRAGDKNYNRKAQCAHSSHPELTVNRKV